MPKLLHLDKKICYENKKVSTSIKLHKHEKYLSLISNKKVLVYGFTDIGQIGNKLIPKLNFHFTK